MERLLLNVVPNTELCGTEATSILPAEEANKPPDEPATLVVVAEHEKRTHIRHQQETPYATKQSHLLLWQERWMVYC